ncbi:MAG: hypothetical protein JKY26_16475 [Pseudomonas sp.]|uniref:hypothetical protein n=1 Tax=Halopseudomonas sp. TaxID=2901191 RepID=UPI001A48D37F|nr:hypothetical protein [Pseudomonas sp.]|tara:strand:+ start:1820 stop:2341 length:522 start_codon:yes stop_codon:yes gene_type:complete
MSTSTGLWIWRKSYKARHESARLKPVAQLFRPNLLIPKLDPNNFEIYITLVSLPGRTTHPALHEVIYMIPDCPACQSSNVQRCHYGKQIGGSIGAVAGTFSGFAGGTKGAIQGARAGATLMSFAGPAAGASGAVIGAVSGGLMGCITGLKLGALFDNKELFSQYRCAQCGTHF